MQFQNLDSAQSMFFRRELELVKSRSYEIQYADLPFRDIFPINNEGGPGVEYQTVQVYDKVGMAKIIASYSDDLPRADSFATEYTVKMHTLGASFGYNRHEIEAARLANKPLEQRRSMAVLRGFEEKMNDIAFNGEAGAGLLGLLNNPNVSVGNVVPGVGGSTEWTTKTPEEILFDMNDAFATIVVLTKKKEQATKVLLPVLQWNLITATARSTFSDTTILEFIVRNSPYLTSSDDVMSLNELEGAGPTGGDVMVMYNPDPFRMEMDIPHEPEILQAQEDGLAYEVPAWARVGGLNVYLPLSVYIVEGI